MARTKPAGKVTFPASASTDVVDYNLYYREVGKPDPGQPNATPPVPPGDSDDGKLSYNDAVVNHLAAVDNPDGSGTKVVIADLALLQLGAVDGQLRVGLSAVDDAGNESDIGPTTEVPFDDVAPDAPGAGVYSAS